MKSKSIIGWVTSVLVMAIVHSPAHAIVDLSPDVTVVLDGLTFNDEDVARLDGLASPVDLGVLPFAADVNGYWNGGDHVLLSFDTTVVLSGGVRVDPSDVVRIDSSSATIEFNGASNGVPSNVVVDAVTRDAAGKLVLSFDTTVNLPGSLIVDDEDLVRLESINSYSVAFDGSSRGIVSQLDLDGAHLASNGELLLSFDGSGNVDGLLFDDEDVLAFDPATFGWSLHLDASQTGPWNGPDLIAVPEPEPSLLLAMGMISLLLASGSRAACRSGQSRCS